jgi:hypothetical protein
MSSLIERVAQLSREDRDWILAHLSAPAKASLQRQLDRAGPDTDSSPVTRADERALDALDGETVAAGLAVEPAWLIAMILSLHSWRWEQQVLGRLAPVTRLEVNQLRGSLPELSPAMRNLLAHTLHEHLRATAQNPVFEHLLNHEMERRHDPA